MPIQHAIWKVEAQPTPLSTSKLASEQALEDMIVREPGILSNEWMLIGRQEQTGLGGRIDLLAIAPDASLVLIELKRGRSPRDLVAQALDYGYWVDRLTSDKIAQIYQRFSKGGSLEVTFQKRFGTKLDLETLNESHQIVLVAAELDDATERIIQYLNDRDIAINVLFFQVFQHGQDQLLSRAWMIEPTESVLENASTGPGQIAGKKKRQWDESSFFSALQTKAGPETTASAHRLLEWCRANVTRIWWGQGLQSGSFVPVFENESTKQLLFAAYTGASNSSPTIQLYFSYWAKRPPFDVPSERLALLRQLNEIPGIALPDSAIDKWPSIPMKALTGDVELNRFLLIMNGFLEKVRGH